MNCPPDHKHGATLNCYNRHRCRCESCRAARRVRTEYERNTRAVTGHNVWVPATGTMRRLQALAVAGWSTDMVAARCGAHPRHLAKIRGGEMTHVRIRTALRVERVARELVMQPRTDRAAKITKFRAAANGWVPAFAWDSIDTDPSPAIPDPDAGVDEIRVLWACEGKHVKLTTAERRECVRILHGRRWSDTKIADQLHCTDRTVLRIRGELGLPAYEYMELEKAA